MTAGGWIMLVVSWSAISAVTFVTLWKTLTVKPSDLTSTLELELENKGPGGEE